MDDTPVSHRTLNELVVRRLREAILNGQYRPGERLLQEKIARDLAVSRIPVREALQRLESEGLITVIPHRGATVAKFSGEEIEEAHMLRTILEVPAARLAARRLSSEAQSQLQRILERTAEHLRQAANAGLHEALVLDNRDFHLALAKASASPRLFAMIKKVWETFPRYGVTLIPGQMITSYVEHNAIYEALLRGEEDNVASLVTNHIESSCRHFVECYR